MQVAKTLKTGLGLALCQYDDRPIYLGSINALGTQDVTAAFLKSARQLHYGSFFLHTGLRSSAPELVRRARALGLSISLDTNWDPEERWNDTLAEVLSLVDVFFPKEQEVQLIAGQDSLQAAASALHAHGVGLLAVKRGSLGTVVFTRDACFAQGVQPVPEGGDAGAAEGRPVFEE